MLSKILINNRCRLVVSSDNLKPIRRLTTKNVGRRVLANSGTSLRPRLVINPTPRKLQSGLSRLRVIEVGKRREVQIAVREGTTGELIAQAEHPLRVLKGRPEPIARQPMTFAMASKGKKQGSAGDKGFIGRLFGTRQAGNSTFDNKSVALLKNFGIEEGSIAFEPLKTVESKRLAKLLAAAGRLEERFGFDVKELALSVHVLIMCAEHIERMADKIPGDRDEKKDALNINFARCAWAAGRQLSVDMVMEIVETTEKAIEHNRNPATVINGLAHCMEKCRRKLSLDMLKEITAVAKGAIEKKQDLFKVLNVGLAGSISAARENWNLQMAKELRAVAEIAMNRKQDAASVLYNLIPKGIGQNLSLRIIREAKAKILQ